MGGIVAVDLDLQGEYALILSSLWSTQAVCGSDCLSFSRAGLERTEEGQEATHTLRPCHSTTSDLASSEVTNEANNTWPSCDPSPIRLVGLLTQYSQGNESIKKEVVMQKTRVKNYWEHWHSTDCAGYNNMKCRHGYTSFKRLFPSGDGFPTMIPRPTKGCRSVLLHLQQENAA